MADETEYTGGEGRSPLQSGRGTTRVEDPVVAKVAGIAAQEIDGVRMGGGTSRALGGMVETVTGGSGSRSRGVSVEVGQVEAAVDLTMAVHYGRSIPQVAEAVRNNVIKRIENLVGLRVTEVNIVIDDIYFENEEGQVASGAEEQGGQERGRVQ